MRIVLLGAPGAGKGSVAKPISEKLKIPVISTGDIFRKHIRENTDLGETAKNYIEKGKLVPDKVTIAIVEDRITRDDCSEGYILDGFPRTVKQADKFEDMLEKKGQGIDVVVQVEAPDEVIVKRLSNRRVCIRCQEPYNCISKKPVKKGVCDKCKGEIVQRDDDRKETVAKRLETYHEQTKPLVRYYETKGLLRKMDNNCSVEEGARRAVDLISNVMQG